MLGNENLYQLTRVKAYKLRIDLEDIDGFSSFAEYQNFKVDSEINRYRLTFDTNT